jgi:N-acyl-D-aspartate/D-glutamate deacylase
MSEEYDLLIKNGIIIDGAGTPSYRGFVAVNGERVAVVEKGDAKLEARVVLDAKGRTITPGFIDAHNHGDLTIIYYPKAESFVRQGITTFVAGTCGHSPGPYGEYIDQSYIQYDIYEELNPNMYYPNRLMQRETLNKAHKALYGWEIDWNTMGGFFQRLEAKGISANYVPFVGHGRIRCLVMKKDFRRRATESEIEEMKAYLEQAMVDGCRGMSVGRDYEPGIYAGKDELVTLAKVVAEKGGVYASHCLSSGRRHARRPGTFPPNKLAGLLEAIDIGRQTGVSVEISHLGISYQVRPGGNEALSQAAVRATLKIIDYAREEGINVNFDEIPHHLTGGFYTVPYLVGTLLPWLKVAGSTDQLQKALKMPDFREEIKENIMAGKWYSLNPNINEHWETARTIVVCSEKSFLNKTIADIAEELGVEPLDALMDVLMTDPETKAVRKSGDESAKLAFLKHPESMVGIDTFVLDNKWQNTSPPWFLPNECCYGGMPRFFRRAVKETGTLSFEEAVRKVTSLPALKFNLKDRGLIKEGAYADIVVMDLENISDRGDQIEPRRYPLGIDHVLVNGVPVVDRTGHLGVTPGKILYRD